MTLQVMLSQILTAGAIHKEKLEEQVTGRMAAKIVKAIGSRRERARRGARGRARRRKGKRKREEGEEEEDVRYPENILSDASYRIATRQMESMNERARDCGERKLTMILKSDVWDLYNSKSHIGLKAPFHTPFYARVHGTPLFFTLKLLEASRKQLVLVRFVIEAAQIFSCISLKHAFTGSANHPVFQLN